MASGHGDLPALESGTSSGLFGGLSAPIGMIRRNISYDEHIDAPMHSPPPDMSVNILWKDPVIPQHKFRKIPEDGEHGGKLMTFEPVSPPKSPVPVVKAKATTLVSTLMIKQTQENLQRFEMQAGLTDTGYSPHKGLSAEETRFRRLGDGTLPKSSTMDGTNTQINLKVEDPAHFMPPKIEISGIDPKRVPPRPHKLKPRDMNVLTPSGF